MGFAAAVYGRCPLITESGHAPPDAKHYRRMAPCWTKSRPSRVFLGLECDGQFVDRSGEGEWYLVVGVIHARARIDADIEGLVNRHEDGHGARDLVAGDFLAIDLQNASAALARAAAAEAQLGENKLMIENLHGSP